MEIFVILTVVIFSQVYTYIKTDQIVHFKYVKVSVLQWNLRKNIAKNLIS